MGVRIMNWVIMITATGEHRRFETLIQNEASQVFNIWRAGVSHVYIAIGNDYDGITYSERNLAQRELLK